MEERKDWTVEEVEYLTLNYNKIPSNEIMTYLDRGKGSIRAKAMKLGLTEKGNRYTFNSHYFDVIDTDEKAYWLGFLWSDGYVCKRNRNGNDAYELNVRLMESDSSHLEKLKKCLDSSHEIKFVKGHSRFIENYTYSKLYISNKHLCSTLYETYGIIPNRYDISKILKHLPKEYEKSFILGVLDADGSFSKYTSHSENKNADYIKYRVSFGGSEMLLRFIESHLYERRLIENKNHMLYKRHKDDGKDGHFLSLDFTGRIQCNNILNYLYDNQNMYLDRKYEKYKNIITALKNK